MNPTRTVTWVVVPLMILTAACSPYYSFLPKFLTYDAPQEKRPDPPPDTVLIVSNDLATMFVPGSEPQDVAVAPPRKTKLGWAFCLTASVVGRIDSTRRKYAYWVTILNQGAYDLRRAEANDQCELEQYVRIVPK